MALAWLRSVNLCLVFCSRFFGHCQSEDKWDILGAAWSRGLPGRAGGSGGTGGRGARRSVAEGVYMGVGPGAGTALGWVCLGGPRPGRGGPVWVESGPSVPSVSLWAAPLGRGHLLSVGQGGAWRDCLGLGRAGFVRAGPRAIVWAGGLDQLRSCKPKFMDGTRPWVVAKIRYARAT